MSRNIDNEKLTAFVLGELSDADRMTVEETLADDATSRKVVDELSATAKLVTEALGSEGAHLQLTDDQRRAVFEGAAAFDEAPPNRAQGDVKMKIVCEACSAKYSIASEKVQGKVFKIRCKKCGETIVVKGETKPESAQEEDAATKVFDYSGYQSDNADDGVWHIVIDGEQQGPYTPSQIHEFLDSGSLDTEAFAWREGFDDWQAIKNIQELTLREPQPVAAPVATEIEQPAGLFDQPTGGLFDDAPQETPTADSPFDSGGLFGSSASDEEVVSSTDVPTTGGLFSSKPDVSTDESVGLFDDSPDPPIQEQPNMTAARNENSVLFSLSNLQSLAQPAQGSSPASETGVLPQTGGSSDASGLIDIRALAGALSDDKEDEMDDLISMGGGFSPALGAPVLAASSSGGMSSGMKLGIAAAAVVVAALFVVVTIYLLRPVPEQGRGQEVKIAVGPKSDKTEDELAKLSAKLESLQKAQKDGESTPAVSSKAADEQPKIDSAKPQKKSSGSRARTAKKDGATTGRSSSSKTADVGAKPKEASKPKSSATSELDDLLGSSSSRSKSKSKKTASSNSGSTGSTKAKLGRSDVKKGMDSVAGKVKSCGKGQHGTVIVKVVIGSSGRVVSASPTGTFAGTSIGSCAARFVKRAKFPKSGSNTSVKYPFKF